MTTLPLTAGDWQWMPVEQVRTWFPSASVWWPEMGFGLKNFGGIYELPVEAVGGLLALAGADWRLGEKILYFWPFAILSFLAPWLLARELLGSRRWAVLSSLIYGTSTYFITFSAGGQMYLAVAEAMAPIVILAVIKAFQMRSWKWALVSGLVLGLQAMYEVRISYLTILLILLYAVFLFLTNPTRPQLTFLSRLVALALAVFAGTQIYWVLPLLTYKGDNGLPFSSEPWIAFMSITNGITGAAPYWTGEQPAIFHYVPVMPIFFIFPLIAFVSIFQSRVRIELLWLATAALLAAFLIKQTNPPFGSVYGWMFHHVPGWSLFREGSKFYFVVAMAYAILIPSALREALNRWSKRPRGRFMSRTAVMGVTASILLVTALNLIPLEKGQIGYTTQPIPEPGSFKQLSSILQKDQAYGAVVWLGGAWINDPSGTDHNFPVRSVRHPLVELLGSDTNGDPFVPFCRTPAVAFCYLDKDLFPYLLERSGARYVVAPAGPTVGRDLPTLPWSTNVVLSYPTLVEHLTSVLGSPRVLDDGKHSIAYWKLDEPGSPVTAGPGVAMVDGTVTATMDALPGIEALGLPVSYSADNGKSLGRQALPASVEVTPRTEETYSVQIGQEFVLMAASGDKSLQVQVGDAAITLRRVVSLDRPSGWSAYGPLSLSRGPHKILAAGNVLLGPCVAWSQLTGRLIGSPSSQSYSKRGSLFAERVTADNPSPNLPWIELRRTYDPGWRLNSASLHVQGDGMFNLYYDESKSPTLTFSFDTAIWEAVGLTLSLVWIAVCIVTLAMLRRRTSKDAEKSLQASSLRPGSPGSIRYSMDSVGRYAALAGLVFLVLAALFQSLAWLGIPSTWPTLVSSLDPAATVDPYTKSESYVSLAMLLLGAGTLLRLPFLIQYNDGARRDQSDAARG